MVGSVKLSLTMSWQAIPNDLLTAGNPNAVALYAVCAGVCDHRTGRVYAGVKELGETCGLSERPLRDARRFLEAGGWLKLDGAVGVLRWYVIPPPSLLRHPPHKKAPLTEMATPGKMDPDAPTEKAGVTPKSRRPDAVKSASKREIRKEIRSGSISLPLVERSSPVISDPDPDRADQHRAREEREDRIDSVIAAWNKASGQGIPVKDAKTRKAVAIAINTGGFEKVERAVRGIWNDEWWAAKKPRLSQAIHNAEVIEKFASLAPPPRKGWLPSERVAFDERWMTAYVKHIQRIVASEKLALVGDPWGKCWPMKPEAVSVVDGVKIPRFEDYELDARAGNLAAAVAVHRILAGESDEARKVCDFRVSDCRAEFNESMTVRSKRAAQ